MSGHQPHTHTRANTHQARYSTADPSSGSASASSASAPHAPSPPAALSSSPASTCAPPHLHSGPAWAPPRPPPRPCPGAGWAGQDRTPNPLAGGGGGGAHLAIWDLSCFCRSHCFSVFSGPLSWRAAGRQLGCLRDSGWLLFAGRSDRTVTSSPVQETSWGSIAVCWELRLENTVVLMVVFIHSHTETRRWNRNDGEILNLGEIPKFNQTFLR